VTPVGHVISDYEFDVIIGADGTRNTLEGSTINNYYLHYSKISIAVMSIL
jgi:hypothetical protein